MRNLQSIFVKASGMLKVGYPSSTKGQEMISELIQKRREKRKGGREGNRDGEREKVVREREYSERNNTRST